MVSAFSGKGTRVPAPQGVRTAGCLCSRLMPALLWGDWGGLGDFEGMDSSSGYGNLPQCTQWPHSDFENLLVAAARWGFGAEIQALPAPGHQKTDMLLKWCTFLCFEWHAYIFSTGSETLHSTSSNFVLLNVPSQRIVQPNYIYVAKSTPLSDFVQYFNP